MYYYTTLFSTGTYCCKWWVEGLEEMDISSGIRVGEGDIDQLMQDLQHSSSSEDEEKEESDIDDM